MNHFSDCGSYRWPIKFSSDFTNLSDEIGSSNSYFDVILVVVNNLSPIRTKN